MGTQVRGTEAVRSRSRMSSPAPPSGDDDGLPAARLNGPGDDGVEQVAVPEGAEAGRPSRRHLKNWRVRSRLLLLIVIPTAAAVVLGAVRISSSVANALEYDRVLQLANLSSDLTVLTQRLQDERDQTVYFIALGKAGGRAAALSPTPPGQHADGLAELAVVTGLQNQTQVAANQVQRELAQIGPSFPALTQQEAQSAAAELRTLKYVRQIATTTAMPAEAVVRHYSNIISSLLVLEDQTAQGASDATLSQTVSELGLVSRMKEEASQQRAILAAALLQGQLTPNDESALTTAYSNQQADFTSFNLSATGPQRQLWNDSLAGSYVYQANQQYQQALSQQSTTGSLKGDQTTADDWYGSMTNEINYQLGGVQRVLVGQVTARAAALRNSAETSAVLVGLAVLLLLAITVLSTIVVARSMVGPLRRLRTGALEVAGVRLPETVRRMSETDGTDQPLEIEPIDVDSADEIGEVARAFDQVHREAVRLASNEAALRGNINAMFVNLSRRSQSLVERQIRLIDDLEQGEQDPERLGNMFQLDHLATRMRRNSENLLVLAGHEVTRRWTQAVALVDVLRAAVSEIEQYERVTLNVQPGISVRGQAVNDVVHLIAELVENATSFSAAETPVHVSGHLLSSGGVLLDITDQGVGMGTEEMAHANWRLDNPPVVDVAVSRRMGLFVVARLAARHGIRVRLRSAAHGGLTALVWLPDEVISHQTSATAGPAGAGLGTGFGSPSFQGGLGSSWSDGGSDDRSAAEHAVSAARTPRFTPLRPDLGDTAAFSPLTSDPGSPTGSGTFGYDAEAGSPFDSAGAGFDVAAGRGTPAGAGLGYSGGAGASQDSGSALFSMRPGASDPMSTPAPGAMPAPISGGASGPDAGYSAQTGDGVGRASRAAGSGSPLPPRRDTRRGIVVPPAASTGEEQRLPIFESVESDWFRRGRHGADRTSQTVGVSGGWSASAADAGWRAAEAAYAPASGGVTGSGLPKRVPKANLIPGTVGAGAPVVPPARSAAQTRERLASFQRGMRDGRSAAREVSSEGDGDASAT
jgi:signal transduction histidine kinase